MSMDRKRKLDDTAEPAEGTKRTKEDIDAITILDETKVSVSKCFYVVRAKLYVNIAPIYVNNASKGVRKLHLDPLLMNYSHIFRGVVVSHSSIEFDERQAKVMYDSPYSYAWVTADFLIWRPQEGEYIEGYINMQSPSHIGLLIHDTFNASIKKDFLPADWTFVPNQEDETGGQQEDEGEQQDDSAAPSVPSGSESRSSPSDNSPVSMGFWVDGQGKRVDGMLRFTIRRIHVSTRMVSVQGALAEPNGGNFEVMTEDASTSSSSSSKKAAPPKSKGKHITFD